MSAALILVLCLLFFWTAPPAQALVSKPATVIITATDANGVKDMAFSVDGNEPYGPWIPYTTDPQTLDISSLEDGPVTIYVKVRDNAGNITLISGSDTKDTIPPEGTLEISGSVVEVTTTQGGSIVNVTITRESTDKGN